MKESFSIQCESSLLTEEERRYLLKWGVRLKNLEDGKTKPKNPDERSFYECFYKIEEPPFSYREKLWFKYKIAKEWSESNRDLEWCDFYKREVESRNEKLKNRKYETSLSKNQQAQSDKENQLENDAQHNESDPDPSSESGERFINPDITGSREDWKKNRDEYDG